MKDIRDNGRALAAEALGEMEGALLDLIAAGSGELRVEVRSPDGGRRRLLITRGVTSCVTVPLEDIAAETFGRAQQPVPPRATADPPTEAPAATAPIPRRYLTVEQVAARYRITANAVRQRLARKQMPEPVRVGQRRLWDEVDLDRFDDAHKA